MSLEVADKYAINELLNTYCHNADYHPPERMREMFTADGIFEVPAMDLRFEGIDQIIAFFTSSRQANATARHIISNVVIEGSGERATSSAYLQVVGTRDDITTTVAFGRYLDELRRTPAGWRLQHRRVVLG
jgi:3-phenylpropionate/cinnamic acid dioxygenase small subunit